MNPSMELLENVLFSIVLNHNTLNSGNVVNSYALFKFTADWFDGTLISHNNLGRPFNPLFNVSQLVKTTVVEALSTCGCRDTGLNRQQPRSLVEDFDDSVKMTINRKLAQDRLWMLLLFMLCICGLPLSAQPTDSSGTAPANQLSRLSISINNSIQSEKETVTELKAELGNLNRLDKSIRTGIDVFNLQRAAFQSLLFLPRVSARQLDESFNALQIAYAGIQDQFVKVGERKSQLVQAETATGEQLALVAGQQQSISSLSVQQKLSRTLKTRTEELKQLVTAKRRLYRKLQDRYSKQFQKLDEAHQSFTKLSLDYKQVQKKRGSRDLFHRSVSPFSSQWPTLLIKRLEEFKAKTETLADGQQWAVRSGLGQMSDVYNAISFIILLGLVIYLSRRLKGLLERSIRPSFIETYPSSELPLDLVGRTATILSVTIFLSLYRLVTGVSGLSAILGLVIDALSTWIVTSWVIIFLLSGKFKRRVDGRLQDLLKRMVLFLRWFSLFFLVGLWVFQYDQAVLLVGRFLLELTLIGFAISIWRIWRNPMKKGTTDDAKQFLASRTLSVLILFVSFSGLVLEVIGYTTLALFWYISWGRTAIVLLWMGLLGSLLNDLDRKLKQEESEETETLSLASYQARWLLVRLLQLGGPLGLGLLLALAWGGRKTLQDNAYAIFTYSFKIGDIAFSLFSVVQAILVLMITHIFARVWNYFLQRSFLRRSRMETGLQDSIRAITVYLIWMLGIILSLNTFGLNPTSLVVVFGALGIGLGFGLQNIFNNFMSGLILLFERPIQVGDEIEINGTWARVEKIKVRSTLVQTLDNASLIIPNSDLINNQVTNWSFKDKRLRRKITVGVAYGSDIELVRQTLLDVAAQTRHVLKRPAADVIFSDFGDSALIFTLRVWTIVEKMWEVETDIRFRIDAEFRQKEITIAFPQQDVHLYPAEVSERKKS